MMRVGYAEQSIKQLWPNERFSHTSKTFGSLKQSGHYKDNWLL